MTRQRNPSSLLLLILFAEFCTSTSVSFVNNTETRSKRELDKVVGPYKYLIFPQGSNVQLIYCMTIGTYARPQGIFTMGVTAGLAWELPHRESVAFRKPAEVYHRRSRRELYPKIEMMLKAARLLAECLHFWSEDPSVEKVIGRCRITPFVVSGTSERELYFYRQGKDGRACVLKALCRAGKRNATEIGKGSFMQEIMHSIFTLPPGSFHEDPKTRYEKAHLDSDKDCDQLYPTCLENM